MTAEVKVKLVGVGDVCVHRGACRNVPTPTNLRAEGCEGHLMRVTYRASQDCVRTEQSSQALGGTHPLGAICTEEPCVMSFLHDDVGDPRLVVLLQADAGLPDRQQLVVQHLHTHTRASHSAPAPLRAAACRMRTCLNWPSDTPSL